MMVLNTAIIAKCLNTKTQANNTFIRMKSLGVTCWLTSLLQKYICCTHKGYTQPQSSAFNNNNVCIIFTQTLKLNEIKQKCSNRFSYPADGNVWDNELNKMMLYQDQISHHNTEIQDTWVKSEQKMNSVNLFVSLNLITLTV